MTCRSLVFALIVMSASAVPQSEAGIIVADPVDDDTTWTLTTGLSFNNNGFGLISPYPLNGSESLTWFAATTGTAHKDFGPNLLGAGEYTITHSYGRYSNRQPTDDAAHVSFLTAGGASLSAFETSRIQPDAASGEWATWSITYVVPSSATEIGSVLGFTFDPQSLAENGNYDELQIEFTAGATDPLPEPSSLTLLSLGLLALIRRRRRK